MQICKRNLKAVGNCNKSTALAWGKDVGDTVVRGETGSVDNSVLPFNFTVNLKLL